MMNTESTNPSDLATRIISIAISILIARYFGLVGLFVIWLIVGGPLLCGHLTSNWIIKKKKAKLPIDILTWLNLILWIIPILGLFSASTSLTASTFPKFKKNRYKVLGGIGLTLSIINIGASAYLSYTGAI